MIKQRTATRRRLGRAAQTEFNTIRPANFTIQEEVGNTVRTLPPYAAAATSALKISCDPKVKAITGEMEWKHCPPPSTPAQHTLAAGRCSGAHAPPRPAPPHVRPDIRRYSICGIPGPGAALSAAILLKYDIVLASSNPISPHPARPKGSSSSIGKREHNIKQR